MPRPGAPSLDAAAMIGATGSATIIARGCGIIFSRSNTSRAIRISLDRPALLRQQLRALILAAEGRPLSVMFPMVAEAWEFEEARSLLKLELDRANRYGHGESGESQAIAQGTPAQISKCEPPHG